MSNMLRMYKATSTTADSRIYDYGDNVFNFVYTQKTFNEIYERFLNYPSFKSTVEIIDDLVNFGVNLSVYGATSPMSQYNNLIVSNAQYTAITDKIPNIILTSTENYGQSEYLHYEANGGYICTSYTSSPIFYINGNSYTMSTTGGTGILGVCSNNTSYLAVVIIIITSDNRVLCLRLYYQANNSGLSYLSASDSATVIDWLNNLPTPPTDPYSNAGDSDTGGGGGSWDDGSDPVNIPNLPSVGATNTGFISLFVPSQSQLKQVAEYMWGGLFDLSTYKRLFEDPMDCILGLSVVPVSVPTSGSANITVGNIELSGISLPVASQQYVAVDCGSLTVTPYFGSYLDYEPYTKMALFVPYSGVHTVSADDLMGRTVNLVYHIDILTGSLVAFLKCGDSVLYEFNGACSSNIPVNSINYASTIENAIRIAVNIGTTVATAGASAPITTGKNAAQREAVRQAQNKARDISLAGSTADGALSLKPNIDRAGSLGGTTGLLGNQTPYFIITRPRLCKPKDQNKIKGYPAFINYSVSDLVGKGYTEFDTILLQNLYLTDDEKNELESILEGGVYL